MQLTKDQTILFNGRGFEYETDQYPPFVTTYKIASTGDQYRHDLFSVVIIATIFHAGGFFEGFLAFTVREIDQPQSADGINEAEACQLVDQTRSQQHNRHVNTNHRTICVGKDRG